MIEFVFENLVLDLAKDLFYNSYSPLWLFLGLGIGATLGYIIGSSSGTGAPREKKTAAPTIPSGEPPVAPTPSAPSGPPTSPPGPSSGTPPPTSPPGPPSGTPPGPPGKPKKGAPPPPPKGGAGASGPGTEGGMGLLTPQFEPCPDLFEDPSGAICKLTGGPLGESRLTGLCKAEWKNCSIRRAMRT